MAATRSPDDGTLAELLRRARSVTLPREESGRVARALDPPEGRLRGGVDLGTATVVMTVLDEAGEPIACEWQSAEGARDGLVVGFAGAAEVVRGMKARLERRPGCGLTRAASGFPPGVPQVEVIEEYTGIPTRVPPEPLLVTPPGMAMNDPVE